MFQLENCTALITGASSGLGGEFARQLGNIAGRLVLAARREGSAKLEPPGGKLFYTAAEKVVGDALGAAETNQARVFPGLPIFLAACAIEALPAPLLRFILGKIGRCDEPADDQA